MRDVHIFTRCSHVRDVHVCESSRVRELTCTTCSHVRDVHMYEMFPFARGVPMYEVFTCTRFSRVRSVHVYEMFTLYTRYSYVQDVYLYEMTVKKTGVFFARKLLS